MVVRLSGVLICASPDDVATVARHLPEHLRLSRAEPACLSFEVTQTDDPMVWQVDEAFADRAGFDAHQVRTRGSAWYAATVHIARRYSVTDA